MTYEEIVDIIDNKKRFGKACGRDVTREILDAVGHPEMGMHIIHIAGTNGKGSVAAFVSSILQAASFASLEHFKVGLFTSPHLLHHTERIRIDKNEIPKETVVRLGEKLLGLQLKLEPTMSDYWLAMALLYYKEQQVKYVVLETGLGGRLDSTSGLAEIPEVCAITSIGLEHTEYLGDTVGKIAYEKAGIIKPNTPVVIGEMPEEAKNVIVEVCKEKSCELVMATEVPEGTALGLFGDYQRKNAAVAIEIIKKILPDLDREVLFLGLKNARWPGRMDVISQDPYILIDGAHNPSGVQALHDSLVKYFPNQRFSFIMAVMADKDYLEMARIITDIAEDISAVSLEEKRAIQATDLVAELKKAGITAKDFGSYEEALKNALTHDNKVIAFGSLYFIRTILKNK